MTRMNVLILPRRQRMTVDSGFLALPTYRSIKIVKAAKITEIHKDGISRINTLSLDALGQVFKLEVDDGWFYKHEPQVGGYLVVYEDGYCSYSPSVSFEKGHIRIDTPAAEPDRSNHAMLRREVQALANDLKFDSLAEFKRRDRATLHTPETAAAAIERAIAMYGEPEQKNAPDNAAAKPTFDILGINKNAAYAYQFDPAPEGPLSNSSDPRELGAGMLKAAELTYRPCEVAIKYDPSAECSVLNTLAEKAEAEMLTAAQIAVMPLGARPAETELALENEFYNKPNLATIMQAFDEMVMQCDEQMKLDNLLAGRNMTHGEVSVLMERARQVTNEGYTEQHDDKYERNELLGAAICYLQHDVFSLTQGTVPAAWPWAPKTWKPKGYRQNLIRAAALILAELDRIDRKHTKVAG